MSMAHVVCWPFSSALDAWLDVGSQGQSRRYRRWFKSTLMTQTDVATPNVLVSGCAG